MAGNEELTAHVRGLVQAVRAQPQISGFVWTQLTGVQQEANGLLFFDRTHQLPVEIFAAIFGPVLLDPTIPPI